MLGLYISQLFAIDPSPRTMILSNPLWKKGGQLQMGYEPSRVLSNTTPLIHPYPEPEVGKGSGTREEADLFL